MYEYNSNPQNQKYCKGCKCINVCPFNKISLENYPREVQNFIFYRTSNTYYYHMGRLHIMYEQTSQYIITNYKLFSRSGSHKMHRFPNTELDENSIKEVKRIFKDLLEAAAKSTKYENPELSIMFDEIGFILAEDYLEVVKKIFSVIDTILQKQQQEHVMI